jgi:hypothetical protein
VDPRRRARQLTAAVAAALVAAACAATAEERDAAERAHAHAERDLAAGRARVAFIGMLHDDESALDPGTGLVRLSVGCCRSAKTVAYRDAYNDAVAAARREGRLAGLTFENRATPREEVEAAFAVGGGEEVRLGGTPAASPDGRWLVEVSPSEGRDSLALARVERASGVRDEMRWLAREEVRIAFAKDGVTLWVRDDHARLCATYDLPTALLLEAFPDVEGL